jgi:hypothetical protein
MFNVQGYSFYGRYLLRVVAPKKGVLRWEIRQVYEYFKCIQTGQQCRLYGCLDQMKLDRRYLVDRRTYLISLNRLMSAANTDLP